MHTAYKQFLGMYNLISLFSRGTSNPGLVEMAPEFRLPSHCLHAPFCTARGLQGDRALVLRPTGWMTSLRPSRAKHALLCTTHRDLHLSYLYCDRCLQSPESCPSDNLQALSQSRAGTAPASESAFPPAELPCILP